MFEKTVPYQTRLLVVVVRFLLLLERPQVKQLMMMSKRATMPLMMAMQMLPIPRTIAMMTLPMVWQMLLSCESLAFLAVMREWWS